MRDYVQFQWWEKILNFFLVTLLKHRDIIKYLDGNGTPVPRQHYRSVEDGKVVYNDKVLYIRRYYLWRGRTKNIFVHAIRRSDDDRDPHDHPWDFTSILLWGKYVETSYGGFWMLGKTGALWRGDPPSKDSWWRAGWKRVTPYKRGDKYDVVAEHCHKLELTAPVWSLVITGPARRHWGFWTERGWIDWREYIFGDKNTHLYMDKEDFHEK